MTDSNVKSKPSVPPMTDFEIDDVVAILMGVKPESTRKTPKLNSTKKPKKLD